MRFYLTPVRMATNKKTIVGEDVEKREYLNTVSVEMCISKTMMENSMETPENIKNRVILLYNPANSTNGYVHKGPDIIVLKKTS